MKLTIVSLILLLIAGFGAWKVYDKLERLLDRHEELAHAQTVQLVSSARELQQQMPAMRALLQKLDIKPERVAEVRQSNLHTRTEVRTLLRDSVVNDTIRYRLFSYHDPYLSVEGVARGDSQQVRVSVSDTLTQVVHRGRRVHPWLWIFSRRELVQTVRMANPNARVVYDRVVRVE